MILDTTDFASELMTLAEASEFPMNRSTVVVDSPQSPQSLDASRKPAPDEGVRGETHRSLSPEEVTQLERQGCTAEDWGRVKVAFQSDLTRVRFVHFLGDNRLGSFRGAVTLPSGLRHLTGVYHATLQDCAIGDDALVRNLRQGMARYDVEAGAVLCDLGCLVVDGEATFGNGLAVQVLREDGELPVVIFDGLSSNIAALLAMSDEGGEPRTAIEQLIAGHVDSVRSRRGRIGARAMLIGCDSLTNLRVGPAGRVIGATRLHNVSINSRADSPTEIGHGVSIADSIVADGAHVDGGAIVARCFIGQGVKMGKHYSATDSLFFANSEAYHGEACSLFAGPYSVTHHKATLLIAARTAFFNAGAGTTQCNHAYKTGPAHYGVLERGCKTGGASVVCWPANVGAFTTVLGKHASGFDTREFPFSYLVDAHGHTRLVPGINLLRVGAWRDVKKWQARDRRAAGNRLDLLHYQALSPWTVQRMLRARTLLDPRQHVSSHDGWVDFAGVRIKREDARRGFEIYDRAVRRYLTEQIVVRLERMRADGRALETPKADEQGISDLGDWSDLGGCYVAHSRLKQLLSSLVEGRISDIHALQGELELVWRRIESDEWNWAWRTWLAENGRRETTVTVDDLLKAIEQWRMEATYLTRAVLDDGQEDLAVAEMWDADRRALSRIRFEASAAPERIDSLVCALEGELTEIQERAARLTHWLAGDEAVEPEAAA